VRFTAIALHMGNFIPKAAGSNPAGGTVIAL
jgi:hypothetical protein